MTPFITTASALRELATGTELLAADASTKLFMHHGSTATFLLSKDDTAASPRAVIYQPATGDLVPPALQKVRREAISRMAAFIERAQLLPLTLPRGWGQYKRDNLVAFAALHFNQEIHYRWIAELVPRDGNDVIFWELSRRDRLTRIEEFESPLTITSIFDPVEWTEAVDNAEKHFGDLREKRATDVDMSLSALTGNENYPRNYQGWIDALNPDQAAFVEAATERSIRLRGPAGSGKTLALALKAIREDEKLAAEETEARIAFVTHSWSLATEVQSMIESMGTGAHPRIDVFPLLAVAQNLAPSEYLDTGAFTIVGDDSLSGKQAQLDEILESTRDFRDGDWITYRAAASERLRKRIESTDLDEQLAFAWDLLIEFGSVIGAAGIFPGAGAESRYLELARAPWMLQLDTAGDKRVVFEIYSRYAKNLEDRGLVTTDQLLADFVAYLESHAWNRKRRSDGYDLVFVDEFHLFNPLERQALHYLNRDVSKYPRLFMAADPRQSASGAFIGIAADSTNSDLARVDDIVLDNVDSIELSTVHRFTPEILNLARHVQSAFPTLFYGHDWDVDFSKVQSAQQRGKVSRLNIAGTRDAEQIDIYKSIEELYHDGPIAIAVVDNRHWGRFTSFASVVRGSGKYHVSVINSRSDLDGAGYRQRGVVIGTSEHLAGLQFRTVLAAGIPDSRPGLISPSDKSRVLTMMYLAITRATSEVRIFVNKEDGGIPEVLSDAIDANILAFTSGTEV